MKKAAEFSFDGHGTVMCRRGSIHKELFLNQEIYDSYVISLETHAISN